MQTATNTTNDCPHVVREFDERDRPYCGQCGMMLR